MSDKQALLQARGLSKSFSGFRVLKDVDLDLFAGTVHAVVGHNGAGKSTLMNILNGVYQPDSGTLTVGGQEIQLRDPSAAHTLGISMVHQELSILPDLTVAENIWLGHEPMARLGLVDRKRLHIETKNLMDSLGLAIAPGVRCSDLGMGARQMVEIARSVSWQCQILILDEPTSALSQTEQQHLFDLVRRLTEAGSGVLYVSHRLDEVLALADTVTILRDGERVAAMTASDLDTRKLTELLVGDSESLERDLTSEPAAVQVAETPGLQVVDLSSEVVDLHNISFSVGRGEILGLAGMLGSGRTELLESLFGIVRPVTGEVRVHGTVVRVSSPIDAMDSGIGLVPQDRRVQGILPGINLWRNMAVASLHDLFGGRLGMIREGLARDRATELTKSLGVKARSIRQEIQFLSGGNQQKVILARWLVRKPLVLLLDDPTAGIDVGAKAEIHEVIRGMAALGVSVLVVSSEFQELIDLCHRILVIQQGRIVDEFHRGEVTQSDLVFGCSRPKQFVEGVDLRAARPVLKSLAEATGERSHLAVLDGWDVVYLDVVKGAKPSEMRSATGHRGWVHSTALGKVLLAFRPEEIWDRYLKETVLEARTERTITNPIAFRAELHKVIQQGYALDEEENEEGVQCIAAPIKDPRGRVVAAISVAARMDSITKDRVPWLVDSVVEAAARASTTLAATRGECDA